MPRTGRRPGLPVALMLVGIALLGSTLAIPPGGAPHWATATHAGLPVGLEHSPAVPALPSATVFMWGPAGSPGVAGNAAWVPEESVQGLPPVSADVTVTPSSGPADSIVQLSASGLAAATAYDIYLDTSPGNRATGTFAVQCTTDATGGFTGDNFCFLLPGPASSHLTAGTSYSVDLFADTSGNYTAAASTPFKVTAPTATVSPATGPIGTAVAISATGLAPNTTYAVYFDTTPGAFGVSTLSFATDTRGTFGGTFYVPRVATVPGSYYVDLYQPTSSGGDFITSVTEPSSGQFQVTVPVSYTITFAETGLPSGTSWFVTLDGTTESEGTPTLMFTAVNGTHSFTTGSIAHYTPTPSFGSVTVNGTAVSKSIAFVPSTSSVAVSPTSGPANSFVQLSAAGLAPSTDYEIHLDTQQGSSAGGIYDVTCTTDGTGGFGGNNFCFLLPGLSSAQLVSGTAYYVDLFQEATGGYTTSASTPFVVTTPAVAISPTSGPVNTSVALTATGLAPTTNYFVHFDQGTFETLASTFTTDGHGGYTGSFGVPSVSNGPGAYEVDIAQQTIGSSSDFITAVTTPASGEFTVTGPTAYPVTFTESGLPSGRLWSVSLNGSGGSSTGSSIGFREPNGTYSFALGPVAGYAASPESGVVTVNGSSVLQAVEFTPVTYTVSFTESGLPAGTAWSVSLNGSRSSATGASIAFLEPNGTYPFTVGNETGRTANPSSGSLTVSGGGVTESITFTSPGVTTYLVGFSESGLPIGTSWSVTLNGSTGSSSGVSIRFVEPNGTYPFSIGPETGRTASPSSGTVTVNGSAVAQAITFTAAGTAIYSLTFTESGLPAGTVWSLTLNGSTTTTRASSIPFTEPNGTYDYALGYVPGYRSLPTSGSITVAGANRTIGIVFNPLPPGSYAVVFSETGLRDGTNWSVELGGTSMSSTTSTITFSELNGTFGYAVSSPGYQPVPGQGNVTVDGAAANVAVTFTEVLYPVTFTETGLPSGANWSVRVSSSTVYATQATVVFLEPNGTYRYAANPYGAYEPQAGADGSFTLRGSGVNFSVAYAWTVTLTFMETGLPNGSAWTVNVTTADPASWQITSASSTIAFNLPANATYDYIIRLPSGSGESTITGSVAMGDVARSVTVAAPAASPAPFPWLAVLLGVVAAGCIAGVAVVLVRRRRARPPPRTGSGAPPRPGD